MAHDEGYLEIDTTVWRARDGFIGNVIGFYRTRDGHEGVVLQQIGTTVVHVYRRTAVEIVK